MSGLFLRDEDEAWSLGRGLVVELLLIHIERNQLSSFQCGILGMSNWEEALRKTKETLRDYVSQLACLHISQKHVGKTG